MRSIGLIYYLNKNVYIDYMPNPDLIAALALDYPRPNPAPVGFLEISGQEWRELTNTRLYAYFLDPANNELVAELFLSSLIQLIREKKGMAFEINEYSCKVEEPTKSRKRIDLLICDEGTNTAIIIENKLGHILDNDLREYFDDVSARQKIGVVLSLKKAPIKDEHKDLFINITHIEWINEIKRQRLPVGLQHKHYIYLNDFFETMEYLTKTIDMDAQTKFFFDHAAKIRQAKECFDSAHKYVISQLEHVAEHFGWKLKGNSPTSRWIWDEIKQPEAYYIFDFPKLLSETREITVVLELYQNTSEKVQRLNEALMAHPALAKLNRDGHKSEAYYHFAKMSYSWDPAAHPNLSAFIITKLEEDFHPLLMEILGLLSFDLKGSKPS